jgi:hypothetical protein
MSPCIFQEKEFCISFSELMNQHFEECFLQYLPAGDLHNISKSNMIPQVMPSDSLIAPTQTALSKFRCSQPPNNSYVFIKVKDDLGEVQVRTQSCGLSTSTINHINIGFDHPSQPNSSSAKQRFDHPDQTHPAPMKRPLTSAARRAVTGGVGGGGAAGRAAGGCGHAGRRHPRAALRGGQRPRRPAARGAHLSPACIILQGAAARRTDPRAAPRGGPRAAARRPAAAEQRVELIRPFAWAICRAARDVCLQGGA